MRHGKPSIALVALLCAAGSSIAQVTPTPEFTGELFEHFVTWPPSQVHCLPARVFDGAGDVCSFTPLGAPTPAMEAIGSWTWQCFLEAKTYPALGVTWAEAHQHWMFDQPVRRFGGFWGVVHNDLAAQGLDFTFYDAALAQVSTVQHITLACGVWTWAGWDSSVPIKRIIVKSVWPPAFGGNICVDALQADLALPGTTCYANCDGSTTTPVLNIGDFTCFLTKFAGGDPYANCNDSTTAPVLNVADFTCFLTKFATGCP